MSLTSFGDMPCVFPCYGENVCGGRLQAIDLKLVYMGGGLIIARTVGFAERCVEPVSSHVTQGKDTAEHLC